MDKLTIDSPMIAEIKSLLESARKNVAQQVNTELLTTYWQIGRIIVEYEQNNEIRAEYALGGLSNNIFASRYVLYISNKEQLIAQVEAVLKKWHVRTSRNKRFRIKNRTKLE